MRKHILVTGANGQLGSEIKAISNNYEHHFYFENRASLDILNQSAVEDFCKKNSINVIINCAAYTAVDKAEDDADNANNINHLAVKYLAEIARKYNISLIHISTDYVFDGQNYKPYCEDDDVAPKSVYGKTKLDGERALKTINPSRSIIIRTSWVYSEFGNNFVKTMLRLEKEKDEICVIFDQVGTPTYAKDLALTILDILPHIDNKDVDLFHYSNEGVCSWYDFAKTIFDSLNISCKVKAIETKDYSMPAPRPHFSLLNKSKIKTTYNIEIPYWKDSLKACLQVLKESE